MDKKDEIRKIACGIRDRIQNTERYEWNDDIAGLVLNSIEFVGATIVLPYVNYRSEVETTYIIEEAIADGKNVFVPKVDGSDMEFFRITSLEQLQSGYQGIREPVTDLPFLQYLRETADGYESDGKKTLRVLMLLPGAAFDEAGHRIGYGKGFYDRYLEQLKKQIAEISDKHCVRILLHKMALAYSCQMFPEIPYEAHDILVDEIVCEKGRMICSV